MKRTFVLFAVLSLAAMVASAADATGKWKGTFDAAGTMRDIVFNLRVADGALTGTITSLTDSAIEIKEGKIKGDEVTFWFMTEYQGNPIKLVCKGKVTEGEINVDMGLDDGQWSTTFVAKKMS
jgi:hypothetical protein